METNHRQKALSRLAQTKGETSEKALSGELEKIQTSLETETTFEKLHDQIELLDAFSYRLSAQVIDVLVAFLNRLETLELTHQKIDGLPEDWVFSYQSTKILAVEAIESLVRLRYFETNTILKLLLDLSTKSDEKIRDAANKGLSELASYNISVFYGLDNKGGIGAQPQELALKKIESLNNNELKRSFATVLLLIEHILSPSMKSTSSTYKTVTWSNTFVPATDEIFLIRNRCLDLLERLYEVAESTSTKLMVIRALESACRNHIQGKIDDDTLAMISTNTERVLKYYRCLVVTKDLEIIQEIENNSYWSFVRAQTNEVKAAARQIEELIKDNVEYQIYKCLVGFEGIFGDWSELKESENKWSEVDKWRRDKATKYSESISETNYEEWRERIFLYSQTKSNDMATFPVFYFFLNEFSNRKPGLALRLLTSDADQISDFIIPIMRGLWGSDYHAEVKALIEKWIGEKKHLMQCTRMFMENPYLDRELLVLIFNVARSNDDVLLLRNLVATGTSNYNEENHYLLDEIIVPSIETLTLHADSNWIDDFWFRSTSKAVIEAMTAGQIDILIANLMQLDKIDYHSDEILSRIAKFAPEKILNFFSERIQQERDTDESKSIYDAVPYELHKLREPLQKNPALAVQTIASWYDENNVTEYRFGGARLLKNIFPNWSEEFEAELTKLIIPEERKNIKVVLATLRNYEGEVFLHDICKRMISALPHDDELLKEIDIILISTGVVSGEFGFAEAYERKVEEVRYWLEDSDDKITSFASDYIADLQKMAEDQRRKAEEKIELGKHKYGE